jgi:hypothetical protein
VSDLFDIQRNRPEFLFDDTGHNKGAVRRELVPDAPVGVREKSCFIDCRGVLERDERHRIGSLSLCQFLGYQPTQNTDSPADIPPQIGGSNESPRRGCGSIEIERMTAYEESERVDFMRQPLLLAVPLGVRKLAGGLPGIKSIGPPEHTGAAQAAADRIEAPGFDQQAGWRQADVAARPEIVK